MKVHEMYKRMICVVCNQEGKNIKANVEVMDNNAFDLVPGWYCSEHVIEGIKRASEEWIDEHVSQ